MIDMDLPVPRPMQSSGLTGRRNPQSLFRDFLAAGGRLDVFMAGDDAQAKARVSAFIKSLGLRPQDTGDLSMAH
jgi:predicted dinucleotide-binding enzyme